MKNYISPIMTLLLLEETDVIRTSVFTDAPTDSDNKDNIVGAPDSWLD